MRRVGVKSRRRHLRAAEEGGLTLHRREQRRLALLLALLRRPTPHL